MLPLSRRSALVTALCLGATAFSHRHARAGTTLLEVAGRVTPPAPHRFDFDALAAIGASELETTTPWTDRPVRFEGVPVGRLLASCGADGSRVRAVALNDYWIEIPTADFQDPRVILAWAADGRRLSVRDKGPLWIVYPWSDEPKYRDGVYEARSIWQLQRLEVL
jgi:hypothetical protein